MEPGLYFMRWKHRWRGEKPIIGFVWPVGSLAVVSILGHGVLYMVEDFTDFIRLPVQTPEEARDFIAGKVK